QMFEGFVGVFLLGVDRGDGILGKRRRGASSEGLLIDVQRAIELAKFLQRSAEAEPKARRFWMSLRQLFVERGRLRPVLRVVGGARFRSNLLVVRRTLNIAP